MPPDAVLPTAPVSVAAALAPGTASSEAALAAATVRAVHDVAEGVRLLELVPAVGVRPYPVGSHLDIAVRIEGRDDVRSYSLVGAGPEDGAYRIAVRRVLDSRGGSEHVRALTAGAATRISRPRSHFELQYGRPEYLLVAGGIGITPMVGMSDALRRHGRPFRLLYAGRTRAQMPFVEQLRERLGERLELFVSAEGRRLDLAVEIDRLHPDGELYLCGPQRLREAARTLWGARGRPPERLRFETFASDGARANEPFRVRAVDHGDREIEVPRHRSLLDALTDNGVEVMWDCRRGECGLCRVRVLTADAEIDHRDVYLSDEEKTAGDSVLACVSRACGGTLTIDTGHR